METSPRNPKAPKCFTPTYNCCLLLLHSDFSAAQRRDSIPSVCITDDTPAEFYGDEVSKSLVQSSRLARARWHRAYQLIQQQLHMVCRPYLEI